MARARAVCSGRAPRVPHPLPQRASNGPCRILGELWPLHCGVVVKPRKEDVLFVPQKPYLVLGSLRDQVIYPHKEVDMQTAGVTDADLARLMDVV